MQTIDKLSLLENLENQVEKHLQITIRIFQNLSDENLLKPSLSGGWSIAQCLEHLNSYGQYYLPLFESGLAGSSENLGNKIIKSSWLGTKAIDSMDLSKSKKKFKAFKGHIPASNLDAKAVVSEFINQQERLLKILRIARSKDVQKIKIPISIAQFLKLHLGDALQFLVMHNERHIQQANFNL
ncbi:DinB family protein [Emticicia sp. SJ17W-69]|uniref:DinB family protein n=1 Tax=Emticicia sp. SJ17W-69 TaxID=3421657 RepID=UPI003EBC321D